MEEAFPEAAAVLREAGWKPHDTWGVYTHGTLVMGSPREGDFHVKNTARCADSPDTPDDPVLAAHWLVARFPVAEASEPEETPAHEAHEETGAEAERQSVEVPGAEWAFGGDSNGLSDGTEDRPDDDGSGDALSASGRDLEAATEPTESHFEFDETPSLGSEILDADYTEPTDPPPEDHPSGAFIFGDNLHQMRTAAIGLVVQAAVNRMPILSEEGEAHLREYRNFAMGVSEGRWPDDPAIQRELEILEGIVRLQARVSAYRDAQVALLLSATREEIEAFDPEAGWPA